MPKASWTRNNKHQNGGARTLKIIGARNRVSLAWNHYMTTRGETVRTALLSHLYPHEFASRANGGQFALCVALMIAQGKTNQDHELYSCFVRNKDVEIVVDTPHMSSLMGVLVLHLSSQRTPHSETKS
jgi:hypothetical protein